MRPDSLSASVDLLNILLQYASLLGMDETTIASETEVDIPALRLDEARIPMPAFHLIWSHIKNRSTDPDFGLHFGEHAHTLLSRHLLYAMMMNCQNMAQAIRKNFEYHNLISDIIQPNINVENTRACLSWEMGHAALIPERHFSESVLALFVSLIQYLTENRCKLTEVRFAHAPPRKRSEHDRIFQAPLLFGQKRNEIILSKHYLSNPILLANPEIMTALEQVVQKALHRAYKLNSWTDRVAQKLVSAFLKEAITDIDSVARDLALSVRSLQLKLKQEGTSFRTLLDEVRKNIAIGYLEDESATICEIALLLGFSDQSAFQHAFKRWTGKTPGDFRGA